MNKLKIQDIPKISGNTILIDESHFKILVEYINKQTEIINTLLDTVKSLDTRCENHSINISDLKTQIANLATIIGGQIYD